MVNHFDSLGAPLHTLLFLPQPTYLILISIVEGAVLKPVSYSYLFAV
jgi:hypothetical protein